MLQEYVQGNVEALEMMAGTLSENRLISPEEIASTLLFCAQNSVINGSVIHANLGIFIVMNQFSEPEHITILRNTLRQFIDKEMPRDKVNQWDKDDYFS